MTGKRGPKSKSKADLKASGSWRESIASDEVEIDNPVSGKGIKTPPSWLTEDEVMIWNDFLPKALEMKTYSNADHFSFGLFCRAANDLLAIDKELKDAGVIHEVEYVSSGAETKSVLKKHPLVDVQRIRRDTFMKFADQFGFNPLARTKLKIVPYTKLPTPSVANPDLPPIEDDEYDDMMGIKKTL